MFQDGKVVFVRHGAVFVRVSPNRLQTVTNCLADDRDRKSEHSLEDRDDQKQDEKEKPEPQTVSEELPAASPDKEDTQNIQQNRKTPKANENIQYKLQNTEEWIRATVLGRAGKATGKNKRWYNIQEEISKEKKSVNLDQVQWELITDEADINLVQKQNSVSNDAMAAKLAELQKLRHFNTYEEVNDCGQNTLSTKWVITNKDEQTKERLVVRGYEEEFTMPRDSPTVDKGTMRICLTISSINN